MKKTTPVEGLIIKKRAYRDADWLITLVTLQQGKLTLLARGARVSLKHTAQFEPGTLVQGLAVESRFVPYLTQVRTVWALNAVGCNLRTLKGVAQVFEIADTLLPEQETDANAYAQLCAMTQLFAQESWSYAQLQSELDHFIEALGYPRTNPAQSITHWVEGVAEKPLHSYQYLTIPQG